MKGQERRFYSDILQRELKFKDEGHERMIVFRLAFMLAQEIYHITKAFPKEEMYSLTDQVRRSSRSVCANIGEGYRKRIYPKSFASKMVDSDGEATESVIHLRFAFESGYLNSDLYYYFEKTYDEVGRMLYTMINNPEKFLPATTATATPTATQFKQ